ncbi:hypothetical protein TRVL_05154 [Trypanosoma vivax]|nr:hypothetical protein TRVL_05154 [Trypanosoma vivax]
MCAALSVPVALRLLSCLTRISTSSPSSFSLDRMFRPSGGHTGVSPFRSVARNGDEANCFHMSVGFIHSQRKIGKRKVRRLDQFRAHCLSINVGACVPVKFNISTPRKMLHMSPLSPFHSRHAFARDEVVLASVVFQCAALPHAC